MKDNNTDKKVITISFKRFLSLAASFVIVLFLGTNLYAHTVGKPNIFTAIRNLFNIDTEDYNAAEEDINITVESNGINLTLKTAAMDDNVLIVKYVAEGEKLAEEFYTYQDFEAELIKINRIKFNLEGTDIGTDEYNSYNLNNVTKMTQAMIEELKELGLTDEDARELENLGLDAYEEYVGVQLKLPEYSKESAEKQVEQTIAMFESKVSNGFSIITSEDKLSGYNIETVAQSIEKEEGKYIIHSIYNVDTLVDILDKFDLKANINKIGNIEGHWNYSVELNKAKLNKRVETIEFYNEYEVIIDSENTEQVEGSNLKVALKQLSISDFSSVLNIRTIKEDFYNKIDYTNLENNIFPVTYVVLDETGKVIGTSCQTRQDAINANPIVDRIILKGVDYNTKKITVKMYSNNDNKLIETLEVNLKNAKKLMDTSLNNNFYNPEVGGIHFKYPIDWIKVEITDVLTGRLKSPENLDGDSAFLEVVFTENEENLSSEEVFKDTLELYATNKIEEKGKILIGVNDIRADYFTETHDGEKWKVIIVVEDETIYHISFGGDEKLYAKYESVFDEILKTVAFTEVILWEDLTEQDKPSNEKEEINIENTDSLSGDVNDDEKVNEDEDFNNKYETSLSWTEYTAPGIKFNYPSDFMLEEVGGYHRGSNPGKISTTIKGSAKEINPNTEETVNLNMEISVYEPLFKNEVSIDKNGSVIINKDGMEWRCYSEALDNGDIVYTYTTYKVINNDDKSNAWEHKIVFTVNTNGSNYLMFHIMNLLLSSTDIISY